MKILKLTYTLLFLMSFVSLKAQETPVVPTQVVAVGSEMIYKVDVENVSSDTKYYWSLLDKDNAEIVGIASDKPSWLLDYAGIAPGKYRVTVVADNYNKECMSDVKELNIELIESPKVKILTNNISGFCSFSTNREGMEEFIFEIGIEGYFGDWSFKYKVVDPDGNEIAIEGKTIHEVDVVKAKKETVSINIGDTFKNDIDTEVFYTVVIEEVNIAGKGGTPDIIKDEDKGKIGIMPVVKIGTITSIKVE